MEILTFAEVRRLLKISQSTLNRLVKSGRLPVVYLGPRTPRVRKEDLEALLRQPHDAGEMQAETKRAPDDQVQKSDSPGHRRLRARTTEVER